MNFTYKVSILVQNRGFEVQGSLVLQYNGAFIFGRTGCMKVKSFFQKCEPERFSWLAESSFFLAGAIFLSNCVPLW